MATHSASSTHRNRLAGETSPYLLQHAANPVDWYPWGEAALERARREDKPILLSIGYSACHWCHVMAHESFEDAASAAAAGRGPCSWRRARSGRSSAAPTFRRSRATECRPSPTCCASW